MPERPARPVLLVVGPPRSGTTLLMQWLARSGAIAYPSNLLSRFYAAPYLGARIQQLLTDPRFDYKDELADLGRDRPAFDSDLGKTRGALEPNEFWYFWRRFFPSTDPAPLSPADLRQVDVPGFLRGLASLEHAFGMPFATKGIIAQYNLRFLESILDRVIFLYAVRDPVENAHSLLEARVRYYGDARHWFSVRPPGSDRYIHSDPLVQVAAQVHLTHASIREELSTMAAGKQLVVPYEEFCRDPAATWAGLAERLRSSDGTRLPAYAGPRAFPVQRSAGPTAEGAARLRDALAAVTENEQRGPGPGGH